jgi:hypothetical protein
MTKDKNGLALRQHDIVRFTEDYNLTGTSEQRCPKGTLGVVSSASEWANVVAVTIARTGKTVNPVGTRLEKVPGQWLPAREVKDVRAGETLIRPKHDLNTGIGSATETFLRNGVHLLVRVSTPTAPYRAGFRDFYIKDSDKYAWSDVNFEVFVPEASAAAPNPRAQAMTFDTARGYVLKFKEFGVRTQVRQRSWDDEARYAALEEVSPGGAVTHKHYRATDCEARLAALRDSQVAVDVVAETAGAYLRFKVPGTQEWIVAPDHAEAWSLPEIKASKGITWQAGKKYRLCVQKVVPIHDEA